MPLNIYLSLHTTVWDHYLYADLDALQSSWPAHRDQKGWDKAVIHVGYDCPDYSESAFPDLSRWTDQPVYLAASAKWAFPADLAHTTAYTLSHAQLKGRDSRSGLHLSLNQWGPTFTATQVCDIDDAFSLIQPKGWVAAFLDQQPQYDSSYTQHAIHDDASFLSQMGTLPRDLQHISESFKFNYLLPSTNEESPSALISILPSQSLDKRLTSLNLTARLKRYFSNLNVEYIRDLLPFSDADYVGSRYFGAESVKAFARLLLLSEDTRRTTRSLSSDLLTLFRAYLADIPARDAHIMRARYALDTKPLLLVELANQYSISFERIRQIEASHIIKFGTLSCSKAIALDKLESIFDGRTQPLYIDTLPAADSWFAAPEKDLPCLSRIIDKLSRRKFYPVTIKGGRPLLSALRQRQLDEFLSELRRTIRSSVQEGLSPTEIGEVIAERCLKRGIPTLTEPIKACSSFQLIDDAG